MYSFQNDYSEGAHPQVLNKLTETNFVQQIGYGADEYSQKAKALIKLKINNPQADVYFVSGGTQANMLVLSSLLLPHEAVISCSTGHIFTNEAGAIESTGHKIMNIDRKDGKIFPEDIQRVLNTHKRPNHVKPKVVYISNSTELGTIYLKQELEDLYKICKQNGLLLFMDGARLGAALTADDSDLTLTDVAKLTDVFYIGGTKNGALLGEAVVFNHPGLFPDFDYSVKQKGALLAKGRLLGIQFLVLFQDNLYFELAHRSNQLAQKLARSLRQNGYDFLTAPVSNQLFPIFTNTEIQELHKNFLFHEWRKIDADHTAVRLITSWATPEKAIDEFICVLDKLKNHFAAENSGLNTD